MEGIFKLTVQDLQEIIEQRKIKPNMKVRRNEDLEKKLYRDFKNGNIKLQENGTIIQEYTENVNIKSENVYRIYNQYFYGKNEYEDRKFKSFWKILYDNSQDKILFLLFLVSIISLGAGIYKMIFQNENYAWIEGFSILIAVFIIIIAGAICEYSQQNLFKKLEFQKTKKIVKILKNGTLDTINIDQLIVGDVIFLEPGDMVPADCLILKNESIFCDESMISGESEGIEKSENDQVLISGSHVIEGTGYAVVLCVGNNSMKGKILEKMKVKSKQTPLQEKIDKLANRLSIIAIIITISLFILNMLKIFFSTQEITSDIVIESMIEAISIAVMTIPEGLAMSITLALSFATRRMLKDNNLVRSITACEVMNSVNYLCIDKTGTLTQNKLEIKRIFAEGTEINAFYGINNQINELKKLSIYEYFLQNAILNSSAFENNEGKFIGSKPEITLLNFFNENKIDYKKIRKENGIIKTKPFNSKDKYMSTCVSIQNRVFVFFKGAYETIIENSKYVLENDKIVEFNKKNVDSFTQISDKNCYKTIGFSYYEIKDPDLPHNYDQISKFMKIEDVDSIFCCCVSFSDPERENVAENFIVCEEAGINPVIITGDSYEMAEYLSRKFGILYGEYLCITGDDFKKATDDQLSEMINYIRVIARATPEDKQRFVNLLQKQGNVVAFIGDGSNDAPAIKSANVGFSMGLAGNDIAKEASDVVLLDDNLSSFLKSISWGRCINESIRKFLQFQLSVTLSIFLITLISLFSSENDFSIFSALQLLWLNLFMDSLSALALSTDKPSEKLLKKNPEKQNKKIITKNMYTFIISSAIFQALIIFYLNQINSKPTLIFNIYFILNFINQINAKSLSPFTNPFENIFKNPIFLIVNIFVIIFQYFIIQKFNTIFKTEPLNFYEWIFSFGVGLSIIPYFMIIRYVQRFLVKFKKFK